MAKNGFSYDPINKTITIIDGTSTVVWKKVEADVAEEAARRYGLSENIDDFLRSKGCERYWGNN
jgi:hypothetical protein